MATQRPVAVQGSSCNEVLTAPLTLLLVVDFAITCSLVSTVTTHCLSYFNILPTTSEYPEAVSSGIAIDLVTVAALLDNTQLSLQDKVPKTKTSILVKVISKPGIVQPIV